MSDEPNVVIPDDESEPIRVVKRLKTRPVVVEDEDGAPHNYTMREMDGLLRDEWLNNMVKRQTGSGKDARISDFKGMTANLLSKCLWDDDTKKLVTVTVVQSWPASVQDELYKYAEKFCRLDTKKAEEEAKNS